MSLSNKPVADGSLDKERKRRRSAWDDEPEDMELTIQKPALVPLDTAPGLFERDTLNRFGGINSKGSVFDSQTLFFTERKKR